MAMKNTPSDELDVLAEAELRYQTDPEFHARVETAVRYIEWVEPRTDDDRRRTAAVALLISDEGLWR